MTNVKEHNMFYIMLTTLVATIGGFLFGFDSGVINGTISGLEQAFNSNSIGTGFNVASMLLGCAIGAFFAGRLADKYGRRSLLILSAVLFIISAWGSGIASTSLEFIVYRVIGGLAVGAASVMAPAYISEIAPAKYRGMLTTIQQVAIISGLFMAFLSNFFLADIAGTSTTILWMDYEAWRWMFWIELLPAFLFLILLMFIPESPRFLVAQNKTTQALKVLDRLLGEHNSQRKLTEIQQSLVGQTETKLSDLLDTATNKVRPIVWVGIGLAVFQQLVGINVVFYYGAVLWQAAGFSESDSLLINVIGGGVSILACFVTMFYVDKIGRKPLLVIGSIGMSISLWVLVYAFSSANMDAQGNLMLGNMGTTALVAANVYVFFFNVSWGPVMWVMLGEMFPNKLRGSGLAIAGLAQWGANFAITISFPWLLASIGLAGAYSFYSICAMLSVFFILKLVNETKGLELEEMQG